MLRGGVVIRFALIALGLWLGSARAMGQTPYYGIRVVDDQTGRGVPLVYLRTTFKAEYVTDSAGYVAFDEPGLMDGRQVWFEVRSCGYESPKGLLGVEGVALHPEPGKMRVIRLKRTEIAQRLYRLTGYGIYRDSVLLGIQPAFEEPLINARVTGQDTVQTAIYRGKYYWMWQDTNRVDFDLGGYSMTGAIASGLPGQIDPDRGIGFSYFVDKAGEFARPMAEVGRSGKNPIWVDGLVVTRDAQGRQRMLARYVAVDSKMNPLESGLVLFNDEKQVFQQFLKFEGTGEGTLAPSGHPFRVVDGGKTYVYFNERVRVEDGFEAASDPKQYETFTCLTDDGNVDRDASGNVRWAWRKNRKDLDEKRLEGLVQAGKLRREELPVDLVNVEDGKRVKKGPGSIAWNPYLGKWTEIFQELDGASAAGEIWFATANSPEGPWRAARKVATHFMAGNSNDFYNPVQHPELARDGGRVIYFEGTFVNTFSGNPHPTGYYDYNNLMYRVDLGDGRMGLPGAEVGLTDAKSLAP
jgi:hypothetical protein